jgi:hypothetical protein
MSYFGNGMNELIAEVLESKLAFQFCSKTTVNSRIKA